MNDEILTKIEIKFILMGESIIQKLLKESFPPSSKSQWAQTASAEIDGNEPFEKLAWQDSDQNKFLPYYTQEDVSRISYLSQFRKNPSLDSFQGHRSWINSPTITVTDQLTANRTALKHLSAGADGIVFNLNSVKLVDFEKLLNDIQWQYCTLSFMGIDDLNFFVSLNDYLKKNYGDVSDLSGFFFWNSSSLPVEVFSADVKNNLKLAGCAVKSSTPVQEIHDALLFGVNVINKASRPEGAISKISFSIPIDNNFLLTISKLKALRLLWFQVVSAYGIKEFSPDDLHIHARCENWLNEKFQPHGNMLHGTTAAMSAIIGGCDSLSVFAEDENNPTMSRIARNVSSILKEESYLDKVADPLAGAYVIENMVDALAKQAWSLFQQTMNKI